MIISAQCDDSHHSNTGSFMSPGGGICVVLMRTEISWNLKSPHAFQEMVDDQK